MEILARKEQILNTKLITKVSSGEGREIKNGQETFARSLNFYKDLVTSYLYVKVNTFKSFEKYLMGRY